MKAMIGKEKSPSKPHSTGSQGLLRAGNENRTRDLRTTNATHYRLCYASELYAAVFRNECILPQHKEFCQSDFLKYSAKKAEKKLERKAEKRAGKKDRKKGWKKGKRQTRQTGRMVR